MKKHTKIAIGVLLGAVVIALAVFGIMYYKFFTTDLTTSFGLISKNKLRYQIYNSETPITDDGRLYLYALRPDQYEIPEGAVPIARRRNGRKTIFNFPYKDEYLYQKFAVSGYVGGELKILATPQYIPNPEMLSWTPGKRVERPEYATQVEALANIPLLGPDYTEYAQVDVNTIQVLNPGFNIDLIHPDAMFNIPDDHPVEMNYRMLNTTTDEGIAAIANELKWYAQNSVAQDYIIGNEVNNRIWNYTTFMPWNDFVREYANGFRVAYNAIKSVNPSARVYLSVDGNWDRNRPTSHEEYYTYMDSKDFLTEFNRIISSEGNIDWGLALHPYIVPPDYGKFWDYSDHPDGAYMQAQIDGEKMYSFCNMYLVTDFMQEEAMRNPDGNVRDIIISELGISRAQGNEVQAASICAAYAAFKSNPYIHQLYFLTNSGFGVDARLFGMGKKAFNAMGTEQEAEYMQWALDYMGAKDWGDVILRYGDY